MHGVSGHMTTAHLQSMEAGGKTRLNAQGNLLVPSNTSMEVGGKKFLGAVKLEQNLPTFRDQLVGALTKFAEKINVNAKSLIGVHLRRFLSDTEAKPASQANAARVALDFQNLQAKTSRGLDASGNKLLSLKDKFKGAAEGSMGARPNMPTRQALMSGAAGVWQAGGQQQVKDGIAKAGSDWALNRTGPDDTVFI